MLEYQGFTVKNILLVKVQNLTGQNWKATLTINSKLLNSLKNSRKFIVRVGFEGKWVKSLILKGKMASLGGAFVSPLTGVGGTRKTRPSPHWDRTTKQAVQRGWMAV